MNEKYHLQIGSSVLLEPKLLEDLASGDDEKSKKANERLNERLKEARVRVGTLLKTDNVSFLIGAGASMDAGGVGLAVIPHAMEQALIASGIVEDQVRDWLTLFYATCSMLTGQEYEAEVRKTALQGDLKDVPKIGINLEDYLSHLHMWRAGMTAKVEITTLALPDDKTLQITKAVLDELIRSVNSALTKLVNLPAPGKESALEHHRRFIKKILTRPLNLRRANLFTLNYDTLIEQAADGEGAVLVDGFVGNLQRIFRPESYDLDFYFPAQTTEGRVHRFDRALHLYKLHGSLTWHRGESSWENPYGLHATFYNQADDKEDVLIYPSPLKYGQALGLPYSELFRRLGTAIAQPQTVLFAMGYGFGDEHVNALIRQALAIPSFTLVVVDPAPSSPFVEQLKKLNDERVWFISGWELGTFKHFVEKLLPDLREEEIAAKVMKTYNALASLRKNAVPEGEVPDDD